MKAFDSRGRSGRRATLACLALAAGVLASAAASAQTRVTGGEFRRETLEDDTLNRKGRVEVGVTLAGAGSSNEITPEGGESTTQSSVYLSPALVGGYMLLDWLELRLTLGLQYISSSVNEDVSQDTFAGVVTVQALLQKDFSLGIGGYLGVGGGAFFGYRDVPTGVGSNRIRFNNSGGVGQVLLGLMVQPGARLMMRGGFRADFLFGTEEPEDAEFAPMQDTFNIQALAELGISFRFN